MDKLPIIMPVKDRLNLTKQTIDSLFENTKLPFELIIVSDNSNQETNEYLKTLKDRARVIFMPFGTGPASAKNAGASIAGNPDYYYFTDNDIYFLPNWLETLYKIDKTFSEVGIVGGRTHPYHGHRIRNEGGISVRESEQQCGYSMLIKREIWLRYGPFLHYKVPEGIGRDDVNLCDKIKEGGLKLLQPLVPVILHCGIKNTWGQDSTGVQEEWNQKFPPGVALG